MDKDLNRFVARMRLHNILNKLGINIGHDGVLRARDIEDAARYASLNFGAPSQVIMSQHSYETLVKHLKKDK